jgi:predicted permease
MLAQLRSLSRALRRRTVFENEMDEEMRFHIESRAADLERQGLPQAEAARRARIEFGSIEKQKEHARASRGLRLVDELRGDVRYALRTFWKNKTFAAAAIVTLALGIGANTAIFTLMDALLLRTLPVYRPQDLVQLTIAQPDDKLPIESVSYPLVLALDGEKDVFDGVAGFTSSTFTVGTGPSMSKIPGALVTGAFYETLGLRPAIGRLLSRADDVPHAPLVAVASYAYWGRAFDGSPSVVGRAITINGVPVEIVGVSPSGFSGANVGAIADLTLPVASIAAINPLDVGLLGPGNFWLSALARPRAGVSSGEATARLAAAWPQIAEQAIDPSWSANRKKSITETRVHMTPGGTGYTYLRAVYVKPLEVLMAMVGLVLFIACANVASLLLARAKARRREIAVRLAIGAGRARIVRQLLVESTLLALIGAAGGVYLATLAGRLIVAVISTRRQTIVFDLTPNWHVLAFTTGIALLTALLFGLAPALQATSGGPAHGLRDDVRIGTFRSRLLPALVAMQMALSLVLLIGAGLFVRTLRNLHTLDAGFRSDGVLMVNLERRPGSLPPGVLEQVRAIPGVVSASASTHTPLSGARWSEAALPAGQALPERDTAVFVGATPGFLETLQIPIVAGRDFTAGDTRQSAGVAIVNKRYAERYFPGQSPLGRHLSAVVRRERRDLEIVGITNNASTSSLRESPPPTVYVAYAQLTGNVPTNLEIRAPGSASGLTIALQRILQPLLPNSPIEVVRLASQIDETLLQERLMATLATGFGALALVLAGVGIYGLLSYTVTQRTREIGVRMALGARRSGVVAMILAGAHRPLLIGVLLALPAALLASRLVDSMLFGLKGSDPWAIGGATLVLISVAHVAAWIPARRASLVDPIVALRHE